MYIDGIVELVVSHGQQWPLTQNMTPVQSIEGGDLSLCTKQCFQIYYDDPDSDDQEVEDMVRTDQLQPVIDVDVFIYI